MKITLHRIRIEEVNFGERHRKEMGDLKGLAASIKTLGMFNPITVAKVNGGYKLLAGARRLKACRDILGESMIEANVVKFDKPLEHLLIEQHENDERKEWTTSEKVAIGKSIEAALGERRGGDRRSDQSANSGTLKQPVEKSRDVAAKAAGFDSHSTYEQAKKVVEQGSPELVKEVDEGKVSVAKAAASLPRKPKPRSKSGKVVFDDRQIQKALGTLCRLIDDRGNKVGKTAEYRECVDATEKVATAWKRWQKAST